MIKSTDKCDIGLIGLAVMGRNLVLNINDNGFSVAVYNKRVSDIDEFLNSAAAGRKTVVGAYSLEQLCGSLKSPKKILLMIRAGNAVDDIINALLPYLSEGDCVVDGGNSFFKDTARRCQYLSEKGVIFCGAGISGGEEGARRGPSVMPGGDDRAWPLLKDILQSICAKTRSNEPCCDWIGAGGAGHYVKMVHNGIEYGDMQLISEAYAILKDISGIGYDDMAELFCQWNKTELESYLIGITADILRYRDGDGGPLLDKILDCAGQKGTGKWMSANALELGTPVTLITEAVYARAVSALVDERVAADGLINNNDRNNDNGAGLNKIAITITPEDVRKALLASKIISYAQGFMLLAEASKVYGWDIDLGKVALLWRGGCIIRSVFLDDIKNAFKKNPALKSLLFDDKFGDILTDCRQSWRSVVAAAALSGIAIPALSSALSFYDAYRCGRSPANLIQAQRDYFGAHTYERVDRPRGEFFHTDWTGTGGGVPSGTYSV
ncbi:MAG: decarboxylating NADP(+)-dependent phosphogluconate dehydrogenase [Chitinispirillales bacterium]|jgi:6-phosphogluconate dehydrogenase|nr:decarboxylating NADP(+)-dependent phosphogluconate dehydrogenase [Chitinispirillales bacterium]